MENMLLQGVTGAEIVRYNSQEICMVLVRENGLLVRERRTSIEVFIPKGNDWDEVVTINKPDDLMPEASMSWRSGKALDVETAEWFIKAVAKATEILKQLS